MILGNIFLNSYYTYFESDSGKIEIAPISNYYVTNIPSGSSPSHVFNAFDLPEVFITVYVLAGVRVIGILFATEVL